MSIVNYYGYVLNEVQVVGVINLLILVIIFLIIYISFGETEWWKRNRTWFKPKQLRV